MANGRHKEVKLVPAAGLSAIAAAVQEAGTQGSKDGAGRLESAAARFDREDFARRHDAFLARLDEVKATLDFDGQVTLEGLRAFEELRNEFIEISHQTGRGKDAATGVRKAVDSLGKRMRDLRATYEMQGGFEVAEARQKAMDESILNELPGVLRNQEIWRSVRGDDIDDEEYARRRGLVIDYATNEVAGREALDEALKIHPEADRALSDLLLLMRTSNRIFDRVSTEKARREVLEQELEKVVEEDRTRQRREEAIKREVNRTPTEKGTRLLDQVYVRAQRLARDTDLWLPAEVSGVEVDDRLAMVTGYIQGAPEHDRADLVDLFTKQGAVEFFERVDGLREMYQEGQRLMASDLSQKEPAVPVVEVGAGTVSEVAAPAADLASVVDENRERQKLIEQQSIELAKEIGRLAEGDRWWIVTDSERYKRLVLDVIYDDADEKSLLRLVRPGQVKKFSKILKGLRSKLNIIKDLESLMPAAESASREDSVDDEQREIDAGIEKAWTRGSTLLMKKLDDYLTERGSRDEARLADRENRDTDNRTESTALVLLNQTKRQVAERDAMRRQERYDRANEIAAEVLGARETKSGDTSPESTALVLLRDAQEQQVARDEARRRERHQQADEISREFIAAEMERVPTMFAEINALLASPELGIKESELVRDRLVEILDILNREDDWAVRLYREGRIDRKQRDALKRRTARHRSARQNLLKRSRSILKDVLLNGSHDNTIEAPAKISGFTDTSRRERGPVPEFPLEVQRIQQELAVARNALATKSADIAAINEALGRAETEHSLLLKWIEDNKAASADRYVFVGLADNLFRDLRLLQEAARERFKAQELEPEPEIELIEAEPSIVEEPEDELQPVPQRRERRGEAESARRAPAEINPSADAPARTVAEPLGFFAGMRKTVSGALDYIRHGWSRVYREEVLGELAPHELDRSVEVSENEKKLQAAAGVAGGLASALGAAFVPDLMRWGTQSLASKLDRDAFKQAIAEAVRTRQDLYRVEKAVTPESAQKRFERMLERHRNRQQKLRDTLANNRRLTPEQRALLEKRLEAVLVDFEHDGAALVMDENGAIDRSINTALALAETEANEIIDTHMVNRVTGAKVGREFVNTGLVVSSAGAALSGAGMAFAGLHFVRGPAYSLQAFLERYRKAGQERARGERKAEVTAVNVIKEGFSEWWTKLTGKESRIRDRRQALGTLTRTLGIGGLSAAAIGAGMTFETAGVIDIDDALDRAIDSVKGYAAELYDKWFPDAEAFAPGTPEAEISVDTGIDFKGEIPEGSRVLGGSDQEGITYILKRVIANNPEAYGFDGDSEMSADLFAKRLAFKIADNEGQMRRWLTSKAIDKLNLFPEFVSDEWHIAAVVDGKKLSMDDLAKLGYTSNAPASSK